MKHREKPWLVIITLILAIIITLLFAALQSGLF
jgi:Na+/melibiose symporter-like transporter